MTLSDRVVIMHQGRIQQIGSPREIYARPANRFVADFIGKANFLRARVTGRSERGELVVDVWGRTVSVPDAGTEFAPGSEALLVVRPEAVLLEPRRPDSLVGVVRDFVYLGSQMAYEVEVGGDTLAVEIADPQEHPPIPKGGEVGVVFKPSSLHLLPAG